MAENAISRRKLICHAPALIAVGVAAPVFATETPTQPLDSWKDRLAEAAVEFRELAVITSRLREESKKGKFDTTVPGLCPEYRAYQESQNRLVGARFKLDQIIFGGVSA